MKSSLKLCSSRKSRYVVQAGNPQPSGLQRDLFPLSHQFRMLAPSLGLLRMKTSLLFLPHPSSLLGHTAELAKGVKTIKQEILVWEWGRWLRGRESACRDTGDRVPSPGREDVPQEGTAAHCSVLAWRVPWTQEPGGLQSVGVTRDRTLLGTEQHQLHSHLAHSHHVSQHRLHLFSGCL